MKTVKLFVSIIFYVGILASCEKFENKQKEIGNSEKHDLSLNFDAGYFQENVGTKATMNAVIRASWETGDKVSVINVSKGKLLGGQLAAQSSGYSVEFSGTVTGTLTAGDNLVYIYPAIKDNADEEDFSTFAQDLTTQTYNPSLNKVAFCGYAADVYSTASISKKITFTLATSYVHLNMSGLPTSMPVDSVAVTNINGSVIWEVKNGEFAVKNPTTENVDTITVKCTGITSTSSTGNAIIRFAVPASSAATQRTLAVNNTIQTSYANAAREASSYYNQLFANWNFEVKITKTGEPTVYTTLAAFRDDVNVGNTYSGYTVTLLKDITYNPENYWVPIGYGNLPFSGVFNGNNHKIEGITIDTYELDTEDNKYWPGGLFGYTCEAQISNLTIYGNTDCGGLIGYAEYTDISDCESYMNSDLCYNISGGLIAHADAYVTLMNCKNYGNFICKTSASYCEVGGVVGRFYGGDHCSVTNCENHGNISWIGENEGGNQRSLGGIVAGFYNSTAISNPQKCVISGCKNYGTIYNKDATSGTTTTTLGGIGGIVGKPFLQSNGIGVTITDCTNYGSVVSSGRAGGIVGTLNEAWQNVGKFSTVSNCTNTGTIYGTDGSRGQIYGIKSENTSDPGKDSVLSNNTESGVLKDYNEFTE